MTPPDSSPSKSARKREQLALQELGESLIALSEEQLATIDLDERLRAAVVAARTMRARGALRRQKQLIGKLMRQVDPAPIRAAIDALGGQDRRDREVFHQAEAWRDRIVRDGLPAAQALAAETGHDGATLATQVGALASARSERDRRVARRSIFREVHRALSAKMQNDS